VLSIPAEQCSLGGGARRELAPHPSPSQSHPAGPHNKDQIMMPDPFYSKHERVFPSQKGKYHKNAPRAFHRHPPRSM
jgi:hypothetical protein